MIGRQLLIDLLPEDIVQSLIPKICDVLADKDDDLHLQPDGDLQLLWQSEAQPQVGDAGTRCIASAMIALADSVSNIRELAAIFLAELGPAAKDSMPALATR